MFELVACNLASLAIALIYYSWRDSRSPRRLPPEVLRERVAYMLWVSAQRA